MGEVGFLCIYFKKIERVVGVKGGRGRHSSTNGAVGTLLALGDIYGVNNLWFFVLLVGSRKALYGYLMYKLMLMIVCD
jgi:hypothetical protein